MGSTAELRLSALASLHHSSRICAAAAPSLGAGYMMIEALVYISVLFALLGVGYAAVYRCLDRSVALRRNADDIAAALHAGERWRADVREAGAHVQFQTNTPASSFHLATARGEIIYRFETNSIFRRVGSNQWVRLLPNVKWSTMQPDHRKTVTACQWDFELLPYKKDTSNTNSIHPLFSFLAVPEGASR
jgi:hypothetical protein